MKITAGKHKGRNLQFERKDGVRPTGSRTREALFNLLRHHADILELFPDGIEGLAMADLCCGTGVVGLEALSRGVGSVTFVDRARPSIGMTRDNAEHLKETPHCRFIVADITRLPKAPLCHQLVVMDPPYDRDLLNPALMQLHQQGWLDQRAVISYERRTQHLVGDLPPHFQLIDRRDYGNCQLLLIAYQAPAVD